jgi:hypothetical protein
MRPPGGMDASLEGPRRRQCSRQVCHSKEQAHRVNLIATRYRRGVGLSTRSALPLWARATGQRRDEALPQSSLRNPLPELMGYVVCAVSHLPG